ncbi:hypothetical protein BKA66DRAFT_577429 [Pyrenochaeta sp. MPI-SDFR-AT-0127]|nr:hypothetical protein BKA66DRAFT_577429 [Pyrenochaeta sp. MPI-SDFR-AT-0127]
MRTFSILLAIIAVHGVGSATTTPGVTRDNVLTERASILHACDIVQPTFTYDELWELEVQLWDNFLYPANLKQAQAINSTLFATDIQGRVDITRNFDGAELNTEYLFGLFTDPKAISLVGVPISYEITEFVAYDRVAAASTIVTFNATTFQRIVPVTIDTFIAWNDERKIWQYDATFRWFGYLLDTLLAAVASDIKATSPDQAIGYVTNTLADSICRTHQNHCTGENQQYSSSEACLKYLTQTVRFGKAHELGQNTLLCRSVHEQMVQWRPAVHCPHIGPSGGGMCTDDQTYGNVVLQKHFTNTPFVRCKKE